MPKRIILGDQKFSPKKDFRCQRMKCRESSKTRFPNFWWRLDATISRGKWAFKVSKTFRNLFIHRLTNRRFANESPFCERAQKFYKTLAKRMQKNERKLEKKNGLRRRWKGLFKFLCDIFSQRLLGQWIDMEIVSIQPCWATQSSRSSSQHPFFWRRRTSSELHRNFIITSS